MATATLKQLTSRLVYPIRCVSMETHKILNTEALILEEEGELAVEENQADAALASTNAEQHNMIQHSLPATANLRTSFENKPGGSTTYQNTDDAAAESRNPTITHNPFETHEHYQQHTAVPPAFPDYESTNAVPHPNAIPASASTTPRLDIAQAKTGLGSLMAAESAEHISAEPGASKSAESRQSSPQPSPHTRQSNNDNITLNYLSAKSAPMSPPTGAVRSINPKARQIEANMADKGDLRLPRASTTNANGAGRLPLQYEPAPMTHNETIRMQAEKTIPLGIKPDSSLKSFSNAVSQPDTKDESNNAGFEQTEYPYVNQEGRVGRQLAASIPQTFNYAQEMNRQQMDMGMGVANSRIENNFHLNLSVNEDEQKQNLEKMKQTLMQILLESARQQGLDI